MKSFLAVLLIGLAFISAKSIAQQVVSPEKATPAKTFSDDVKKIMDEGISGKYSNEEKCPDTISGIKEKVNTDDVSRYIEDGHKGIMEKNPLKDPAQGAIEIKSLLDAAIALQCQIDGKKGKAISKNVPERWLKILGSNKGKRNVVLSDAILDYGFLLQKDGDHEKALISLKAARGLNSKNETSYLYTADSLWALQKYSESKNDYKKYSEIRKVKYGPHGTIIPRVQERLSDGKAPKK